MPHVKHLVASTDIQPKQNPVHYVPNPAHPPKTVEELVENFHMEHLLLKTSFSLKEKQFQFPKCLILQLYIFFFNF